MRKPFRFTVSPRMLDDSSDRALHCALYALDISARRSAVEQSVIEAVRAASPRIADEHSLQLRLDEAERTIDHAVERRRAAAARAAVTRPVLVASAAIAVLFPVWIWLSWPLFAAVAAVLAIGAIAATRDHLVVAWATCSIARASRVRRRMRDRQDIARQVRVETEHAVRLVLSGFDATYEEARSAVVAVQAVSDADRGSADASADGHPDGDILAITRNPAVRDFASEPRSVP